jgi:ribose-phosphate pyrophosphokinase
VLIDDIVDTAGTLCNAAVALVEAGASRVYAYVTHGVLSGNAVPRVTASPIEMLVITDSIVATEPVRAAPNIRQLTIAPLMAEAMQRISEERSVSSLFD